MSFSNFLSTSLNHQVSLVFAEAATFEKDSVAIQFVMMNR